MSLKRSADIKMTALSTCDDMNKRLRELGLNYIVTAVYRERKSSMKRIDFKCGKCQTLNEIKLYNNFCKQIESENGACSQCNEAISKHSYKKVFQKSDTYQIDPKPIRENTDEEILQIGTVVPRSLVNLDSGNQTLFGNYRHNISIESDEEVDESEYEDTDYIRKKPKVNHSVQFPIIFPINPTFPHVSQHVSGSLLSPVSRLPQQTIVPINSQSSNIQVPQVPTVPQVSSVQQAVAIPQSNNSSKNVVILNLQAGEELRLVTTSDKTIELENDMIIIKFEKPTTIKLDRCFSKKN